MDRARLSQIAHADHRFANPLGEEKIDRLLGLLDLAAGARVLDIGCGNAELLIRLVERSGIQGAGVDPSAAALAEARRRMARRGAAGAIELHQLRADEFRAATPFDAALCVGSSHAYGGLSGTLAALGQLVRPGGLVLVGEGYWKQPPAPEYLALLGAEPDELTTHPENIARAEAAGFPLLYSAVSSDDDWDHYEGLYRRAVERWTAAHPDDPESSEYRAYIRRWYDGYLRWGRGTLGFGLYLLRVDRPST